MNEPAATRTVEIQVEGMHSEGCVIRVRAALAQEVGIEHAVVTQGRVLLDYYPEVVTLDSVRASIEALGYAVPKHTEARNPFRRFLERMSAENEKTFGHERLDCCTMRMKNR
jgi:copper chaperone CopZ